MSLLFFSCAHSEYADFASLFCLSAVMNVPDCRAEVWVEHLDEAAVRANEMFPGKVLIRVSDSEYIHSTKMRFLEQPETKSDYVYISDVDIIFCDPLILQTHLKRMSETGLPYSNSIRENDPDMRLSGLHFTQWDAYYPISVPDPLPDTDETTLYEIILRRIGSFPPDWFRPVPGIHISPNREPMGEPGWMIEPYMEKWLTFAGAPEYKAIYPYFSDRIKDCIKKINYVCDTYRNN